MSRLDFLAVWHRTVALYLQRALDGSHPLQLRAGDVGDPMQCEVGQWLAAQRGGLTSMPSFQELLRCHESYHAMAGQLLTQQRNDPEQGLTQAAKTDLQRASDAVSTAIERLIGQMSAEGHRPRPIVARAFWDDQLRVGIDVIDQQHEAIAELATRIAQAPECPLNSESGVGFLTDFYRLVAFHFDTEEQLMATASVSADWRHAHIQEHSALLEQIVSYSYDQTLGHGPLFIADLMQDLREIIVSHVLDYDFGFRHIGQTA